jgi:hypothetical protein
VRENALANLERIRCAGKRRAGMGRPRRAFGCRRSSIDFAYTDVRFSKGE